MVLRCKVTLNALDLFRKDVSSYGCRRLAPLIGTVVVTVVTALAMTPPSLPARPPQ
ncbi:hypothetical protein ACFUJY_07925 [Streptomyces sp. NPDC057249]|uniref:hypothetical protein n=1 Tax=Streptomyces sp. NPDC057249 TaxID=3346067 RepID=UPI0036369F60